jgi:ECF sigma factor
MVDSNTNPIPSPSPVGESPAPPQPPIGAPDLETSEKALRAETFLRSLHNELRQMAGQIMAGQSPSNTLQATALVHEAWIKLGNGGHQVRTVPSHFRASATQAIRHILIDRALRKLRHMTVARASLFHHLKSDQ